MPSVTAAAALREARVTDPSDGGPARVQMNGAGGASSIARKPNVLLLTDVLGVGGAEVVVRDLARHLDRSRFNVSVYCLRALGLTGAELRAEGCDVAVPEGAGLDRVDYFTALKLRRYLHERQIDVVHSHSTHALVDAAVCRSLSRRVRVVHTFHFGNYPHQPTRTLLMEALAARRVDRLVAVGESQLERIRQTYRLSPAAIRAVRNGVSIDRFPDADPAFRREIGAEGKILVGTVSHLCPQKGLSDLLAIARRVRDVRPDVHFVVVGGGDLRDELERRKRELNLEDTVTFTGLLTNAAARALPSFDLYIQTSHWEAMSISILEAMAAGKCIVSTDVGETPRVIDHGAEGFLHERGDVEGMTARLLALAADPDLRARIGVAASRTAARRFTVDHMTRAYEEIYLDLLGRTERQPTHAAR